MIHPLLSTENIFKMATKKFDIAGWFARAQGVASEPSTVRPKAVPLPPASGQNALDAHLSESQRVDELTSAIEASHRDITGDYNQWMRIGFALVEGLGEAGRSSFRRISQFYPGFSETECDEQYTKCVNSKGNGVTLATLFHYAKLAGIIFEQRNEKVNEPKQNTLSKKPKEETTFPAELFQNIPPLLQAAVKYAESDEERDMLLLASMTTISPCLPRLCGLYDSKVIYPCLYFFVVGPASAGKGRIAPCRRLANKIHAELRRQYEALYEEYKTEVAAAAKNKNKDVEVPRKPPLLMLILPANNSASGIAQILADNDGCGLLFETEADTLGNTLKTDYGNYSDILRKNPHHEVISLYRRTNQELIYIDIPRFSAVFAGTWDQLISLIPGAENGLFSRFIYYPMDVSSEWRDVFANLTLNLDEHFDRLGREVYELNKYLASGNTIWFSFTPAQQTIFNQEFSRLANEYFNKLGEEFVATVRRLGLTTFRLAMVFSALRLTDTTQLAETLVCEDRDFESAIQMARVIIRHSARIYGELIERTGYNNRDQHRSGRETRSDRRDQRMQHLLEMLPFKFNRKQFIEIAANQGIHESSAERFLEQYMEEELIKKCGHNQYENPAKSDIDVE
jgi:hypothetical protein